MSFLPCILSSSPTMVFDNPDYHDDLDDDRLSRKEKKISFPHRGIALHFCNVAPSADESHQVAYIRIFFLYTYILFPPNHHHRIKTHKMSWRWLVWQWISFYIISFWIFNILRGSFHNVWWSLEFRRHYNWCLDLFKSRKFQKYENLIHYNS